MRRPTTKQKPQTAKLHSIPAPIGGLISNRSLAMAARVQNLRPGAEVLENWFPIATGIITRRGSRRWATIGGPRVRAMFSYTSGEQQELFAATDAAIWDITNTFTLQPWALSAGGDTMIAVDETPGGEVAIGEDGAQGKNVFTSATNGDWSVVQFTTAGGTFLVGVNGTDPGFIYDGTTWESADTGTIAITFPTGSTLTTADLSYVWMYQKRIWFIEKNSLNVWYLPVDQVGGELTLFPLGGVFPRGGTLLWGQSWSLANGGAGGLSDQCVFCTTEGEVASYQGIDPGQAATWSKVGNYRIGRPLGRKALIKAGGDLVIATTLGFVSLQMASQTDSAALGARAVSSPIEDEWAQAVQLRGQDEWRCQVWADGQMVLIAPPTPINREPVVFVANSVTGAWGKITGWDITAMEVFRGSVFFGSRDGNVRQGWVGGTDEGKPFTCNCLPLYDSINAPASIKLAKMARAVMRSAYAVRERVTAMFGFSMTMPPPPNASAIPVGNEWDNAIWNQSLWDAERASIYSADWRSVGGSGADVSVAVQITSGSDVPLDTELVRIDLTYSVAGMVT